MNEWIKYWHDVNTGLYEIVTSRLISRFLVPRTPTALIIFMVIYYKTLMTTAMGTVVQVQNNQYIKQQYDNAKLAETLV